MRGGSLGGGGGGRCGGWGWRCRMRLQSPLPWINPGEIIQSTDLIRNKFYEAFRKCVWLLLHSLSREWQHSSNTNTTTNNIKNNYNESIDLWCKKKQLFSFFSNWNSQISILSACAVCPVLLAGCSACAACVRTEAVRLLCFTHRVSSQFSPIRHKTPTRRLPVHIVCFQLQCEKRNNCVKHKGE